MLYYSTVKKSVVQVQTTQVQTTVGYCKEAGSLLDNQRLHIKGNISEVNYSRFHKHAYRQQIINCNGLVSLQLVSSSFVINLKVK